MHVRSWGKEGQQLVLLLHALGCHSGWWQWVAEALADRYRLVAPDFRGHGETPRVEDYSFAAYAADVERLVEGLGGGPYLLAGHSMGGYVALMVAHRGGCPPAAVLVADMKTGSTGQELADLRAAAARPGRVYASLEEAVGRYRLAPPEHAVPAERLGAVARECFRQQADGSWAERFDRRALAIESVEPLPLVADLRVPVLFVRGECSLVMPKEPAEALAAAAGASLVELPGLYHHLPLEAPGALAGCIAELAGSAFGEACSNQPG